MPTRRKSTGSRRGSSRKSGSPVWLIALLLLSFAGLGVSLWLLHQERQKAAQNASLTEKALRMADEHPDAEVFQIDPGEKKKVTTPPAHPVTPQPPRQPAQPAAPPPQPPPPPPAQPAPNPPPAPSPAPVPPAVPPPAAPTPIDVPPPPPAPAPEPPAAPPAPPPAPAPPPPPEPPTPAIVKRATPIIGDAPVSELDFAAWQIRLERWHFSCGTIDGDFGMRSRRALTQFQRNRGLPVTGQLDVETRMALGFPGNAFTTYTVTPEDMATIQPTPRLWADKARATFLGYNDPWEMLGEKFHAMPSFLQKLNPGIDSPTAGTQLTVPNLAHSLPLPKADRIVILLSETTLLAYRGDLVVACFPCSIAANRTKRPSGELRVRNKVPNPNYTFDPAVLTAIAEAEGLTRKMILPPGPNNPVGLAWIGLSLPGYGIHGTPEPADISRTGSSGCFRLANWNARKMLQMVDIGTLVEVIE